MKKIVFMDGFDSVRDAETQSKEIFSTKLPTDLAEATGRTHIPEEVIDDVVSINNRYGMEELDDYLLYNSQITQDEREIIVEAIFEFNNQ